MGKSFVTVRVQDLYDKLKCKIAKVIVNTSITKPEPK